MRIILLIGWFSCGFVGAGYYRASLREATPYLSRIESEARSGAGMSSLFIIGGPVYLLTGLAISGGGYSGWENPFGDCYWHATTDACEIRH
jgi:hypothetical protein